MSEPIPGLDALRAFEAAARLGSLAAAGRELGVTPSAISHRIRGLEAEVGLPLLIRTTRSVALTAPGARLAPAVAEAVGRLQRGLREARTAGGRGALVVSCSPSFALRWLVPRLHRFSAQHPEIDVRISSSDALVDPAREGVDVCLRYGPGGYEGLDALQLTEEEVFPVCGPALAADLREPADLARHPLLAGQALADHPGRPGWAQWLEAAGVGWISPDGPRLSHTALAIEAAMAGRGVALGRTTLVADALERGLLVRPFALALPSPLVYWFVTPPGGGANETGGRGAVAAFRRWLIRELV